MSKRVYELAKELGVETKALITRIKEETDIFVDTHLTALTPDEVDRVRTMFAQPREGEVVQKRISSTVIRRRARHEEAMAAASPPSAAMPPASAPVAPTASPTRTPTVTRAPVAAPPVAPVATRVERPAATATVVRRPAETVEPAVAVRRVAPPVEPPPELPELPEDDVREPEPPKAAPSPPVVLEVAHEEPLQPLPQQPEPPEYEPETVVEVAPVRDVVEPPPPVAEPPAEELTPPMESVVEPVAESVVPVYETAAVESLDEAPDVVVADVAPPAPVEPVEPLPPVEERVVQTPREERLPTPRIREHRPREERAREAARVAPEAAAADEPRDGSPEDAAQRIAARIGQRRAGPLYADAEVTVRARREQEGARAKVLDRVVEIVPERPRMPLRSQGGPPQGPGGPPQPGFAPRPPMPAGRSFGPPPPRMGGGYNGPPAGPSSGPAGPPAGPPPPPGSGKEVSRRRTGRRVYERRRDDVLEKGNWDAAGPGGRGGRKTTTRRKAPKITKLASKTTLTTPKEHKRVVKMGETITVGELAQNLSVKASEIIKRLIGLGMMATINQALDFDTATLIAAEYEFTVESIAFEVTDYIPDSLDAEEDLSHRAPVVTIMGHVDHGKTSLLDAIQNTRIAAKEAGGITQHIGAYVVEHPRGQITFIDTPGHEAFTAMRARGAQVTDIVILVVAADDGVMPQTVEAINHARAAEVPIVVAVNKIDKGGADPTRVRQALTEYGLVAEEWGGDAIFCDVSAKQKVGIDELLDMVLLQAEVLELRANPAKKAKGIVIEAQLDPRRGPVATVLVQEGTLRQGDMVVSGSAFGRVRKMANDRGAEIDSAGPSTPVVITGWNEVPSASDIFNVVEDDKSARTVAEHRAAKDRESRLAKSGRASLENLFAQLKTGETKELRIILKADAQGSIEAIRNALERLSTEEVEVRIIHSAVGGISESDINLASASDAIVIGFNVRPELNARQLAEQDGVDVKLYSVIYDAVEDVKAAITGMLAPTLKEVVLGHAEVRELFHIPKAGVVSGVSVKDGKVVRGSLVRLVRDSVVVWEGKMSSLRRFKEDVREVKEGYECGIGLENYNDVKLGDVIESYEIRETPAGG